MEKTVDEIKDVSSEEKLGIYENFSVISVAFSSTFTAVTTFFTSIIISRYNSYNPSVNIPTLFLIISTFGFLYATLVYANIGGLLARKMVHKVESTRRLGNILSEYLGVYFLILAIPLIINVISKDPFLRVSTAIVDIAGLCTYHISGFSIMERNYRKSHLFFLGGIIFLEVLLIISQFSNIILFEAITVLLILFILFLAIFAHKETIR